ncbi:programmed cell death 1 ligand 2-like [Lissotriton helveticus]
MSPLIFMIVMGNLFHPRTALFSVEVPQSSFIVRVGGEVALECNFPFNGTLRVEELMIIWLHSAPSQTDQREVISFHRGKIDLPIQDGSYRGRATLLNETLYKGQAVLQITDVKLSDSGIYRCIIGYGGADYKHIQLTVGASYGRIHTQAEVATGGKELILTCSAEGFPLPSVFWQCNKLNISLPSNTSNTMTADGLYNVTSAIRSELRLGKDCICLFWNKDLQEITSAKIFSQAKQDPLVSENHLFVAVVFPVCVFFICVAFVVILKRRKFKSRLYQRSSEFTNSEIDPNIKTDLV